MTIIFTNSDFWIEEHLVDITTGAGIGDQFINVALDKGGRFVGGSATFDGAVVFAAFYQSCSLKAVGGAQLIHGVAVTTVRADVWQLDATSRAISIKLLVIMRK